MRYSYNGRPYFTSRVQPYGKLPDEPPSHALWYFIVHATEMTQRIRDEVEYEGEEAKLPLAARFRNLVQVVTELYGVTPEMVFQTGRVMAAQAEVRSLGGRIPEEILRWIASGGVSNYMSEVADSWLKGTTQ